MEYCGVSVNNAVLTTHEALHVRNEKVAGSIPVGSTIQTCSQTLEDSGLPEILRLGSLFSLWRHLRSERPRLSSRMERDVSHGLADVAK